MSRLRLLLGLVAGTVLVVSSIGHSFLGWKQLGAELGKTTAPPDLVASIGIGWNFGGLAMLVFGLLVLTEFILAARTGEGTLRASFLIGVAYIGFGAVSMLMTGHPFFLVFVVPGVLLALAAWPRIQRDEGSAA